MFRKIIITGFFGLGLAASLAWATPTQAAEFRRPVVHRPPAVNVYTPTYNPYRPVVYPTVGVGIYPGVGVYPSVGISLYPHVGVGVYPSVGVGAYPGYGYNYNYGSGVYPSYNYGTAVNPGYNYATPVNPGYGTTGTFNPYTSGAYANGAYGNGAYANGGAFPNYAVVYRQNASQPWTNQATTYPSQQAAHQAAQSLRAQGYQAEVRGY